MSGLYPDDLAARLKLRAGEKYRPSNGTEGMEFQSWFCDRCGNDQEVRYRSKTGWDGEDTDCGQGCVILAASLAYDVDDPDYPPEWQYGSDGQPVCTAFIRPEAHDD